MRGITLSGEMQALLYRGKRKVKSLNLNIDGRIPPQVIIRQTLNGKSYFWLMEIEGQVGRYLEGPPPCRKGWAGAELIVDRSDSLRS